MSLIIYEADTMSDNEVHSHVGGEVGLHTSNVAAWRNDGRLEVTTTTQVEVTTSDTLQY